MLRRDKDSQEGYIHICNDSYKYTKQALKERIPIYLHDITAYMYVDGKIHHIKYCPYCGADVDSEEREG